MNCSHRIMTHSSHSEPESWFVNHNFERLRARDNPSAETDVHGPVAESVRNPLEEQTSWVRKAVQFAPNLAALAWRERAELTAPDTDWLACVFQLAR